jgi:hypothetical protein
MAPNKREGNTPLLSIPVATFIASSSLNFPAMNSSTTLTYKPFFGLISPPSFMYLSTHFYKQTTAVATTAATTTSIISVLFTFTITSISSKTGVSKPVIGLGMNLEASTMNNVTTTSASQWFLLGVSAATVSLLLHLTS